MKTIVFFNNKSTVGKTSLVYHLSWMFSELGVRVAAADFDPQANLTSLFLDEERLEEIWPGSGHTESISESLRPILKDTGDIEKIYIEKITEKLTLIPGHLGLSEFEDIFSYAWTACRDGDKTAFRRISALYRMVYLAGMESNAQVALLDVGPNLGAINRAAVIAADYVIIPLAPDLYSLEGLKSLGPSLRRWRKEWEKRSNKKPRDIQQLPGGEMKPLGYIIMRHITRKESPFEVYRKYMNRIPGEYRESVLGESSRHPLRFRDITEDSHCIALNNHYRSLIQMAVEAKKPMFLLKPADGAIGGHAAAVRDCFLDFRALATKIAQHCGIDLP